MRIFTLGKNGIPLFFFALFLLTGTYSYGQCPTIDASTQYFCDSQEAEIEDLEVTSGTAVWYTSQSATDPIPANTFLVSGTYYAGNDSCAAGSRIPVEVVIASEPEILGIRSSTTPVTSAERKQSLAVIGVCVANVNDPGLTIDDLRTNAADEDQVRWYYTRTGGTAIPAGTDLQNNTDYYAALVSADGSCETNRRKTTVRFYSEAAPTGPAEQEFCAINNPTIGDIEASGDNRYFSTLNSQVELSPNTTLTNGTYYISAVGENCESIDRLAVTVTVTPPVELVTSSPGIVCELDVSETFPSVDAIRNYYLSLLGEGVPTNGTFNPTPAQMATQYQNDEDGLGDFTTTYTVGCNQVALTITIVASEDANAGNDVSKTFQPNDGQQNLFDFVDGGQTIGTFEGYPDGMFDPSSEGPGIYTIDYTVDETSGCIVGSDTATFTITVAPCEVAGEDVDTTFCQSEAIALANAISADPTSASTLFIDWIGERSTEGTFDGNIGDLSRIYTGPFPITITGTYIVDEGGVCEDEANITVTIVEDVDAGEDGAVTLDPEDAPVNLFDYLGGIPDTDGTWSSGNGNFDPATDAAGTYTYTVGTEGCTDSADVIVTITTTPPTDPTPADGYAIVCQGDVDTFFPSYDEIRKFYLRLLPAGVPTNGTFNPTPRQISDMYQADEDRLGEFTTVYTVGGESYELTVNIVTEAEAGDDATVTLTTEDDAVNLFDYLGENALRGGTWSSGNGTFDPATDEAGTFTYTVGYETCMDSATVTVIVNDPTDPTDPTTPGSGYAIVCQGDVDTFFPSYDEIRKFYLRLLPAGVPTNGTFNPTPRQISEMYQADADKLGEFTTIYTVNEASYELTVNIVTEAEAGENATVELTTEDEPVNLFDYLGEDALPGGTWSSGNGTFDPATDEAGSFTYTVGYEGCMDSATVNVVITDSKCEGVVDAGTDNSVTICETDVDEDTFSDVETLTNFYLVLLDPGVATTGTFDPTPAEILIQYANDEDGLGEFSTIYTLTEGECSASVELTVNIVPVEEANAGTIADFQVCTSGTTLDLFDYLADDSSLGGSFSDAEGNEITDGALDISEEGEYTITYTVSEEDAGACVTGTDSTEFTVTVGENTANAGADNAVTRCNSQVRNLSNGGVRNLYLSLLEDGVATNGTFNPTIQQIIDQYNFQSNFGDFTTVYTVGTGNCTDSVELTVTVVENLLAGENATVTLTEEDTEVFDLFDELGGTPDEGGTWTDAEGNTVDGSFDPTTDEAGVFTYTIVSDNGCEDSATVTVVFEDDQNPCEELPAAPTVADFDGCVVNGDTVADLDITVEDGNTFAVYTDAALETPAVDTDLLVDGEYFVTQTTAEGCESPAATITVTLSDNDAPTISMNGSTFCTSDNATLADLEEFVSANGDIAWYTTETGGEAITTATALVDGVTYYASSTGADSDCESSERLAVTITLETCEIPEAFSPNGDGVNDTFFVNNLSSNYPNHMMEIYNRWGEPVYNGKAGTKTEGWDGTSSEGSFGSGVLPAGVYFYILYYNDGQTAPIQGRLYLSR